MAERAPLPSGSPVANPDAATDPPLDPATAPDDGLDEATVASAPAVGPARRRSRSTGVRLPGLSPEVATWGLVALLVLAMTAAVVFFVQASVLRREVARLEEDAASTAVVREAAEVVAARVTTFSGADIDAWVQRTQELSTGEYAEEVAELFDQELRAILRDNGVESVGEVLQSYVQDLDEDSATVFLIVRQTSTSTAQPTPVQDELRMEVGLERVGDRWLAATVAVLGRPLLVPTTSGAEGGSSTP